MHFSPISSTVLHFDSRGGFGYVRRHSVLLLVLSNSLLRMIYIIFSINKCKYVFLNNTGNVHTRKRLNKEKKVGQKYTIFDDVIPFVYKPSKEV